MSEEVTLRRCSKCFEQHPITFFNKDRSTPDGLYPQCKNCSRRNCRRTYEKYHDKHVEMKRRWKAENPEKRATINREWQKANPHKVREYSRVYKRKLAAATPPWVDTELLALLRDECPEGWEIDHVFPVQHKDFCGLNVPDNLQVITVLENRVKGNRVYAKYLKGLEKSAILSQ